MPKYKIGDRVEYLGTGRRATVINPDLSSRIILIEFDESFNSGHDGGGVGKQDHCWYCREDSVTPIPDDATLISDDWESLFGAPGIN